MVPSMGTQSGRPSVMMSSVGVVLTITSGTPFLSEALWRGFFGSDGPVMGSMTFARARLASRLATPGGTLAARVHGPAMAGATTKPSKRWT